MPILDIIYLFCLISGFKLIYSSIYFTIDKCFLFIKLHVFIFSFFFYNNLLIKIFASTIFGLFVVHVIGYTGGRWDTG